MAGANSQINLVGLDFDTIKTNLKTFLKSQDTFKDYNFEGSGMSILLDVLAYNTQYNSFYLNMVANETFLDTALQRSSVVSQAKLLNYTPKSTIAPTAYVDVVVTGVSQSSLTLPAYTNFLSESVDGTNFNFVTTETSVENTSANTVTFSDVELKQGIPVTYRFTVDSTTNPTYTFELPDSTIDTSSLLITVQQSSSNSFSEVYTNSESYLMLDGDSRVFFLQESLNGNYEVIFGDGILGKKLIDGNIVIASYISTQGTSAAGANNFVLMDSISGFTNTIVYSKTKASPGSEKESIDSIKFQAPKTFASQGRAVTKDDYITAIQRNTLGYEFDAVNVWGGEENDPPVYGQIFVCLKPNGSYSLTEIQKKRIVTDVLRPISLVTVSPTIVDPDYTYIKVNCNVFYDPTKTTMTSSQLQEQVKTAISSFASNTLNTFNSTFLSSELTSAIQRTNGSIVTNEITIQLQKKFYPNLTTPTTYKFYYGAELIRGMFQSNIGSSPSVQFRDPSSTSTIVNGIYLEEIPSSTGGVDTISIVNPGFGYQVAPTVTILGDGQGATASATINNAGQIEYITVNSSGNNYTSAIATITPAKQDTTGRNGVAVVNLKGRYGQIRSFYNDTKNVKTIFKTDVGTIDYAQGIVTLNSFNPVQVDNELGILTLTVTPSTTILSSSYDRILTLDPFDPNAITVNVIAKK